MSGKTWAIYTDLSGCGQVVDGGFATEEEANARLIEMLAGRRADIAEKMSAAMRRRRILINRRKS